MIRGGSMFFNWRVNAGLVVACLLAVLAAASAQATLALLRKHGFAPQLFQGK